MGCWGITAFESDTGLDAIGLIRQRTLPGADVAYFERRSVILSNSRMDNAFLFIAKNSCQYLNYLYFTLPDNKLQ